MVCGEHYVLEGGFSPGRGICLRQVEEGGKKRGRGFGKVHVSKMSNNAGGGDKAVQAGLCDGSDG